MKLKVNLKNTFIKHKFPLATFFISFIIMLIGFAVIEISPFGKNQINSKQDNYGVGAF